MKVVWSHGLYSPRNSPGQNTGVGSLCLLQKIFPTQGLKACLLHCRWVLYQLNHKGSPRNSKDSGVKNWRDSGSNQHFEKCWFKFCPRIVLNAELPRTFNMQSSMLFLRGGGTYFVFSIFFFFLNYELNLSETIFTGLTLQVIYCNETVAGCNNAYVRILDKEKCYFLRWLMSGASGSGV